MLCGHVSVPECWAYWNVYLNAGEDLATWMTMKQEWTAYVDAATVDFADATADNLAMYDWEYWSLHPASVARQVFVARYSTPIISSNASIQQQQIGGMALSAPPFKAGEVLKNGGVRPHPNTFVKADDPYDDTGYVQSSPTKTGDYNIIDVGLPSYRVEASDYDTTDPDGDDMDKDTATDLKVANIDRVTVEANKVDSDNDYVNSNKGLISGSVTDEAGEPMTNVTEPMTNVTLPLMKPDVLTVTILTDYHGDCPFIDWHGDCPFIGLPPGNYTFTATNLPGYPGEVSGCDEESDRNVDDTNTLLPADKVLVVPITPEENEFVHVEGPSEHGSCAATHEDTIGNTTLLYELLKHHSSDGGMAMPRVVIYKLFRTMHHPFIIENHMDTFHFPIAAQPHWEFNAKHQKLIGISPHSLGARYQPIDRGRHDVEELHLHNGLIFLDGLQSFPMSDDLLMYQCLADHHSTEHHHLAYRFTKLDLVEQSHQAQRIAITLSALASGAAVLYSKNGIDSLDDFGNKFSHTDYYLGQFHATTITALLPNFLDNALQLRNNLTTRIQVLNDSSHLKESIDHTSLAFLNEQQLAGLSFQNKTGHNQTHSQCRRTKNKLDMSPAADLLLGTSLVETVRTITLGDHAIIVACCAVEMCMVHGICTDSADSIALIGISCIAERDCLLADGYYQLGKLAFTRSHEVDSTNIENRLVKSFEYYLTTNLLQFRSTNRTFSVLAFRRAAVDVDTTAALASRAANEACGLAMESMAVAHSGHMGLPLGVPEIGATILYGPETTYSNPKDSTSWITGDRFLLSAGHGYLFRYSCLNLTGFDLPTDALQTFRQHHSMTPGHPALPSSQHNSQGIESTTGPLGQGIAAGIVASEKIMAVAVYNSIGDHDRIFLEGVTSEAACSTARTQLYNNMDESTEFADTTTRYAAYVWELIDIDGPDLDVIQATTSMASAMAHQTGKLKFISCNAIVEKGMEDEATAGTNAAQDDAAGVPAYVDNAKKHHIGLGLPASEKWNVSSQTTIRTFFAADIAKHMPVAAWYEENPALTTQLDKETIRAMVCKMVTMLHKTDANIRARRFHTVTEHIMAGLHFDAAAEKEPGTVVVVDKALIVQSIDNMAEYTESVDLKTRYDDNGSWKAFYIDLAVVHARMAAAKVHKKPQFIMCYTAMFSVDCGVIADSTNLQMVLCLASHDLNTTPAGSSYKLTPHSPEIVQLLNETAPFNETFFVADHSVRTAKPDTRYAPSLCSRSLIRDRNLVTGIPESVAEPVTRERDCRDHMEDITSRYEPSLVNPQENGDRKNSIDFIGRSLHVPHHKHESKRSVWHHHRLDPPFKQLPALDLPIEEQKTFRQYHSMPPGHPELPHSEHNRTFRIEHAAGPLRQGITNSVGLAASETMAASVYITRDHKKVLARNGCFQESVTSYEKLDARILLYADANKVILHDKLAAYTPSSSLAIIKHYEAHSWEILDIDNHNLDVAKATFAAAKANNNGQPTFLKCNTSIDKRMDVTDGTDAAHYEAGVPYVDNAKQNVGHLAGDKRYVSQTCTRDFFADVAAKNKATCDEWQVPIAAWYVEKPALAKQLQKIMHDKVPTAAVMNVSVPATGINTPASTRISPKDALPELAKTVSQYISSGTADLPGSCRSYIDCGGNFCAGFAKTHAGRNVYFGIREHDSVHHGFAYHDLFKAFGFTFLLFMDYLSPILTGFVQDLWIHVFLSFLCSTVSDLHCFTAFTFTDLDTPEHGRVRGYSS